MNIGENKMPLIDYKIFQDEWFARRPDKMNNTYIDYRIIISASINHYKFSSPDETIEPIESIEQKLKDMIRFIENDKDDTTFNAFTLVLDWNMNPEDKKLFLVDKEKSVYPMVFSNRDNDGERYGSNRISAILNSARDVSDKLANIYELLGNDKDMDFFLQLELQLIFVYVFKYSCKEKFKSDMKLLIKNRKVQKDSIPEKYKNLHALLENDNNK